MVENKVMSFESQHKTSTKLWESLTCPHCKTLFKVSCQDLSSRQHYSFSCLSCNEIFWAGLDASNNIEVLTSSPKIQEEMVVTDYKICPHCYQSLQKGVVNCNHCGKSFYDAEWTRNAPYSSFQLRKVYEELMKNYNSNLQHEKFITRCLKEDNIDFGIYCYGELHKQRPTDAEAIKRLKSLQDILSSMMVVLKPTKTSFGTYTTGWVHALLFCAFAFSLFALFLLYVAVL